MYPKENGEEETKTTKPASLGQHLLSLLDSTSQPYNFYSLPIPKPTLPDQLCPSVSIQSRNESLELSPKNIRDEEISMLIKRSYYWRN
jgi:hypothetical protein